MQKTTLLFFLVLFSVASTAQEIKVYKTFGGVRFERDTAVLSLNQVLDIVKENPEAYTELKIAKKNSSAASAFGFAGGLLIVLPVGTAIGGGTPEWGLAAGGVGLLLLSIPFNRAFRDHTMHALDFYNGKNKTSRLKPEFQLYGSGARLVVRF
jgi:hypothetical protein